MMLNKLFIKLYFVGELLYFSFSESEQVDVNGPKCVETDDI